MSDYLDDDLDLADGEWDELEAKAIQSTQAAAVLSASHRDQSAPRRTHGTTSNVAVQRYDGFESDEEDSSVLEDGRLVKRAPRLAAGAAFAKPAVPQSNLSTTQRFPMPILNQNRHAPSEFPQAFAPPPPRYAPSQSQAANARPKEVAALQQRLRRVEHDLNVSRGETSIVRSKETKIRQAHEDELARLKALHAEQLEAQKKRLEELTLKERTASTELEFLQRDLNEATSRNRRKDHVTGSTGGGEGGSRVGQGTTTPRKSSRNWSMADGFEDADLAPSPTKAVGRTKPGPAFAADRTPTKGKRKRPAADSPLQPLETHTPHLEPGSNPAASPPAEATRVSRHHLSVPEQPIGFDFLPLVLDTASAWGQKPTFDILSQYSLPSDPDGTSFSSIIYSSLRARTEGQPAMLLSDLAITIVNLWARCVEDQLLEPVKELVSLLTFAMQLPTMAMTPRLMYELMGVAESTLYMVSNARKQTSGIDLGRRPHTSVDSADILSLLHLTALASAGVSHGGDEVDGLALREAFWKNVSLDLVRAILSPSQPLHDMVIMLDLLCVSVFPTSLGPINQDGGQERHARSTLDYVSKVLVSNPAAARSPTQKHAVAKATLRTLLAFTTSEFGINQLAAHTLLMDRLVAVLSESVNQLYNQDIDLEKPQDQERCTKKHADELSITNNKSDAKGLCRIISQATLLLYTLATDPRTCRVFDTTCKSLGGAGVGRYQIALCRLSCAEEDLVLYARMDTESADRATELLNLLVTPDEAEIIREAFSNSE